MTDEERKQSHHAAGEAWQEVGQQFRTLGESLAAAFRTTWQREETRQHLKGMQSGLEAMVEQIGQVVKEATESGEARKVQVEVEKLAQSARSAGQEVAEEVQPQLLAGLRKMKTELDQMISRLEEEAPVSEASTADEAAEKAE